MLPGWGGLTQCGGQRGWGGGEGTGGCECQLLGQLLQPSPWVAWQQALIWGNGLWPVPARPGGGTRPKYHQRKRRTEALGYGGRGKQDLVASEPELLRAAELAGSWGGGALLHQPLL